MQANNDYNSLWTIKEGHNYPMKHHSFSYKYQKIYWYYCLVDPVKCGDTVRLEHSLTKKNLHTHAVRSPLSGKQEISCFGNDGDGDTGKNFLCIFQLDFYVKRG